MGNLFCISYRCHVFFIVNYYGSFLQVVLKYWLSYITLSVYFGSGYANLPINPPQFC